MLLLFYIQKLKFCRPCMVPSFCAKHTHVTGIVFYGIKIYIISKMRQNHKDNTLVNVLVHVSLPLKGTPKNYIKIQTYLK